MIKLDYKGAMAAFALAGTKKCLGDRLAGIKQKMSE